MVGVIYINVSFVPVYSSYPYFAEVCREVLPCGKYLQSSVMSILWSLGTLVVAYISPHLF